MRFDIISANPGITESFLAYGLISRAIKKGIIEIYVHHLRDYADGKNKSDGKFGSSFRWHLW